MQTKPLTALVVTYNRLEHLKQTLARLLASGDVTLQRVIVVDNASDDGTEAWLKSHPDPRVLPYRCGENTGGAGGFTLGISLWREAGETDWVVLMDDDGRPEPGALEAFVNAPRKTNEIWLGAVYYPDGDICEFNRPWVNPFWSATGLFKAFWQGRKGFHISDAAYIAVTPQQIDGGSFVAQFVSRRAVDLGGLPDADLFIYGDDVLFTLGLRKAGGTIGFDPAVRFEHDCRPGHGVGTLISPLWKLYFLYRNQIMMYRSAAGPFWIWPALMVILPLWWWRGRKYQAEKRRYRALFWRAVGDGLRGRKMRKLADITALLREIPST